MKKLTILITTYNRKDRLIEMLKSIEKQGMFDFYNVLIVDNHSNYDVKEAIRKLVSSDFYEIIRFHRWNFNIGMSSNISVSFAFVETDWCLYVSDDDEMTNNSIATLLHDIKENPNALAIKYSLADYNAYPNSKIENLNQFVDYYKNNLDKVKEMFYLSRAYNLNKLNSYLTYLTDYSYTYISFIIPLLFALRDNQGYILTRSFSNIKYKVCESGENWYFNERFVKTMLGMSSLEDLFLNNKNFCKKNELLALVFSFLQLPHLAYCLNKNFMEEDALFFWKKLLKSYCLHKPIMKFIPSKLLYSYYTYKIRKNK